MPRRLVSTDRRFHIVLCVAAVVAAVAIAGLGVALGVRFSQTNDRRTVQNEINARLEALVKMNQRDNRRQDRALEQILCFARAQVAKADATPTQKDGALRFYDHAFRILHIDQPCQERR